MNRPSLEKRVTSGALQAWSGRVGLEGCDSFRAFVVMGNELEEFAIVLTDITLASAGEPHSTLYDRV